MLPLLISVTTSYFINDTNEIFRLFESKDGIVGLFYYSEDKNISDERPFTVFKQAEKYYPNITFGIVNCHENLTRCHRNGIEPSPAIYTSNKFHSNRVQYTNEFSLFPILYYLQHVTRQNPINITLQKPPEVNRLDVKSKLGQYDCSAIFYTDMSDRMSQILIGAMNEIADAFKYDNVFVGQALCNKDLELCFKMNVTVAPLLRVYKSDEYYDYEGIREVPQLLSFINSKCGTHRLTLSELDLENALNQKFEALLHNFWTDTNKIISELKQSENGENYLVPAEIAKESGIEGLKKCLESYETALESSSVKGKARDNLIIRKHVCNVLINEFSPIADEL